FDAEFYLESYPDVREARIDPFLHYMQDGWKEGRNPSKSFRTERYLKLHDDVRMAGINPFLHYVQCGATEGQSLLYAPNADRDLLEHAIPPSVRAQSWRLADTISANLTQQELSKTLLEASRKGGVGFVVSISHDDYFASIGGTQNIIGDEMRKLVDATFHYLHIYPAHPLPTLAPSGAGDLIVGIRLNEKKLGFVRFSDLVAALRPVRQSWPVFNVIVHHLLGHRPEDVAELVAALLPDRVFAFVHDFFSFCISYTLLRNDVTYCNSPDVEAGSCLVCCYGEERKEHLRRISAFLAEVRPTLVIYSQSTRDIWEARSPFVSLDILPARLAKVELDEAVEPSHGVITGEVPLRIGFVGTPAHLKGWNTFASLAKDFRNDGRYQFVQLSARSMGQPGITHVPVSVLPGDRMAMVRTLREQRIDVAVIWSLWPETFCFTAYEAMAAGAYIVTRTQAGNVWPGIRAEGERQGTALDTSEELHELLANGDLIALACAPGRKRGKLIIEAPLAEYILQNQAAVQNLAEA
ncbi:hypothetical protein ACFFIC_26280, partial [Roseomonas vinacea]